MVVYEVAVASHREGFKADFYHFAIHAGDAPEFARMLYRPIVQAILFAGGSYHVAFALPPGSHGIQCGVYPGDTHPPKGLDHRRRTLG